MNRSDIQELHYIAAIDNIASIIVHGILPFRHAERLQHASVAMPELQAIRARKRVPGGRPLHDYVNLYLCARNPMLYKRKDLHAQLCVLRVDTAVLDLPDVVIADGNAASHYTAFWPSPAGLAKVDGDLVFAEYWTDADQIAAWHKKRVKCAEVLVPDRVNPDFICGAYVSCENARCALAMIAPHLDVGIDARLFFR